MYTIFLNESFNKDENIMLGDYKCSNNICKVCKSKIYGDIFLYMDVKFCCFRCRNRYLQKFDNKNFKFHQENENFWFF